MATPEGKVKRQVSTFLRGLGPDCYYFMPVQMGYGASALDYMGCFRGRGFAIETKAFGKKPTSLQEFTIKRMVDARMQVFVVSDPVSFGIMQRWFTEGDSHASQQQAFQEGHSGRSSGNASVRARRAKGRKETQSGDEEEKGQEGPVSHAAEKG